MACDVLDAGVNVLVTKPWCLNEAEARRMIDAAERSGKLLLPWLPSRWSPVLRRLQEIVADGMIGKVFLVRRAEGGFARRDDWQMRTEFGGGYLLNWGPHIVDTAVLVTGGRVVSAYGQKRNVFGLGDAEDLFTATLTLDDGTLVQAEYTVAAEKPPAWILQGDGGTVVVRGGDITIHAGPPKMPGDPTEYAGMAAGEMTVTQESVEDDTFGSPEQIYREVAAALRDETDFPVTPADALELTRTLDAIAQSAQDNRVVTL